MVSRSASRGSNPLHLGGTESSQTSGSDDDDGSPLLRPLITEAIHDELIKFLGVSGTRSGVPELRATFNEGPKPWRDYWTSISHYKGLMQWKTKLVSLGMEQTEVNAKVVSNPTVGEVLYTHLNNKGRMSDTQLQELPPN